MVATSETTRLQITSNTGARVKRVHHQGRDYLVAPASLIVPGVLNGSDGAGYYPLDEIVKNVKAWDDMPIVVYHPTKNGYPVAAMDPLHTDYVLRESGVGFLRNTRGLDRLASEAWFDEEYVQDYDRKLQPQFRIYPRLLRNESIELSTGLIVHKDFTPGSCPKTGKSYDWVARNHQPDHLAVLPDQRGACSVEDGCGITVNEPSDKLEITPEKACQIVKDGEANGHELTEAQRGMFGAKCGETRNGETDMLNNADGWVTLPNGVHIQIKDGEIVAGPKIEFASKEAADRKMDKDARSNKTHKFPHGKNVLEGDEESTEEAQFDEGTKRADEERSLGKGTGAGRAGFRRAFKHGINNEENDMAVAMTPEIRKGLVDRLVTNCKCGDNPDAEVLNRLSDRTLLQLNSMPEALARAKAKKSDPEEEEDDDDDGGGKGKNPFVKNHDVTISHSSANISGTNKGTTMVNNSQVASPISAKEWLEQAPPEIRSIVVNALETEREVKQDCINRLVANVTEKDKEAYTALYNGMDNRALKMLVKALPVTQNASDLDRLFAPVQFQGAVGGPEGQHRVSNIEFEPTEGLPVTNWEEEQVAEERLTRQRREASVA